MLIKTNIAHLVSSSSKKYLPSYLKLLSLKRAWPNLAPNMKMTTQKDIYILQKSTPPSELNHFNALGSLAAIVCLNEHSMEKSRDNTARNSTGDRMLFRGDRV